MSLLLNRDGPLKVFEAPPLERPASTLKTSGVAEGNGTSLYIHFKCPLISVLLYSLFQPVPTAPRTPRTQQQDGGAAPSSAQSKPPRPPVGPRPSESCQAGSHSESKTPHGGHQDNTSPPHKPPSSPPPLSSPTPGRKHQADISHGQQSSVSRHPPTSPGRAKGGQTLNQHPQAKPTASFFHNSAQQHSPPSKTQSVSPEEAGGQEEGKIGFGISLRMYNFKAIKDKMSKVPTQSKKGSSNPTAHARKSSS